MNSVYDESGSGSGGDAGARLSRMLDRAGSFLGKIGFGLFLLLALGATLVATTIVGIMLALAAGFLTVTQKLGRKRSPDDPAGADDVDHGPPPTLEAHRTADGWVTEPMRR